MGRKRTGYNKIEYNIRFNKEHTDRINYAVSKKSHLKERIQMGAKFREMSVNGYITMAVTKQLDADNIPEITDDQAE